MSGFDPAEHLEGFTALGTTLARNHGAQVQPVGDGDVPVDVDTANVVVVEIGAGDHVRAISELQIREDPGTGYANSPEAPRIGSQQLQDLVGLAGSDVDRSGSVLKLLLVEFVVATQQHERRLAVEHIDECLDLAVGGGATFELDEIDDGAHVGRGESLGLIRAGFVIDRGDPGRCPLDVGCVSAGGTVGDVVLACRRGDDELDRVGAPHRSRRRFDRHSRDPEPLEDAVVRREVPVELLVEARRVHVEAVRVLHRELADAKQTGLRACFVAELGLDLVPQLRELLVGSELRGDSGEDLFVGRSEDRVSTPEIAQREQDVGHRFDPPGLLPDLSGVHGGEEQLLSPDGVELFSDDRDDLGPYPIAKREERVHTGHQLPDVAASDKQAMARCLSICRIVSKGGNERL